LNSLEHLQLENVFWRESRVQKHFGINIKTVQRQIIEWQNIY